MEIIIQKCLEAGILAPSTHNSQPWKIRVFSDHAIIHPDPTRFLEFADSKKIWLYVSLGCFVENVCIAARHYHYNTDVTLERGVHDYSLKITFIQKDNGITDLLEDDNESLYNAITKRVNNRNNFSLDPIDSSILEKAQDLSAVPNVHTRIIVDRTTMKQIAQMTGRAVKEAQEKKGFRVEFSKYLLNNLSRRKIGMPGYTIKLPLLPSLFAPLVFRYLNPSKILGFVNEKAMLASSAHVVFFSSNMDTQTIINSGRAFERMALYLTSMGIAVSVHVAISEVGNYPKRIQNLLSTAFIPLMVFRIGRCSKQVKHPPRLQLKDLMT